MRNSGQTQNDPDRGVELLKEKITVILGKKLKKVNKRIKNISKDLSAFKRHSELSKMGEMIKAQLHRLPLKASTVNVKDWENDKEITLTLDPLLTVKQNMALFFKKASKMKRGSEIAGKRYEEGMKEASKINKQINEVENMTDIAELKEVYKKLLPPVAAKKQVKRVRKQVGKAYLFKGYLFFVGRSDLENDELVKHVGNGNDWWFHIKDYPGSHVVLILGSKQSPDFDLILFGSALALSNSKAAASDSEEVIYTQKKYLRKVRRGKPGQFLFSNEKTVNARRRDDLKKFRYIFEEEHK
ncbi:DUF814 domain-containing protein [bacterium]|nr:DUF814 domain-containing protein [bacterium]